MNPPEGLEELRTVEEVTPYQGSYCDYSAILSEANTQEVRVHYLRELRDEWEWTGDHTSEEHDNGYVHFTRKG